jgi:hypothetical protein
MWQWHMSNAVAFGDADARHWRSFEVLARDRAMVIDLAPTTQGDVLVLTLEQVVSVGGRISLAWPFVFAFASLLLLGALRGGLRPSAVLAALAVTALGSWVGYALDHLGGIPMK